MGKPISSCTEKAVDVYVEPPEDKPKKIYSKTQMYKEVVCPSGLTVRIWNLKTIRDCYPVGAILCDRRTPFGNKFVIGQHGNRHDVCRMYKNWIYRQDALMKHIRLTLGGKTDLVCHCAPLECHVETIAIIANPRVAAKVEVENG